MSAPIRYSSRVITPHIDFVNAQAVGGLCKCFIALFLLLAVVLCNQIVQLHRKNTELSQACLQLLENAKRNKAKSVVVAPTVSQEELNQYAALSKVSEQLANPLHQFQLIESCASSDWAFLSVKTDSKQKVASISAETRDVKTLAAGIDCLNEASAFEEVRLNTRQRVQTDPQRPLRVELGARW